MVVRETDWPHLTKQLLGYTAARTSHFGDAVAFLRSKVEIYVLEAVRLILDGTRQFDPAEESLFRALASTVDSLIAEDLEKSGRSSFHLLLVPAAPGEKLE
jgi:hypothetical protein